ncbi:parallel beta helix pectate lyase-like protein [Leucobacter luti]|uniref:Parallel beta helix pectate lyase-like protein n=1 Tax=Leucobacter luti TaxID=340320 RepID=A0A4R6RTX8_9MICO|nr:NosD domain-containing protein [Leucobacter luti]TDP89725.1 parallel beta helix pectate lyase-like protein [Leucobacter luti]
MRVTAVVSVVFLAAMLAMSMIGCATSRAEQEVVRVPQDASTITEAIDAVAPNGLILVGDGVYEEEVLIDKEGVTIRGENRNETVIDAGGIRPYGIVGVADGVTVENLTVTGATFYGVLITGMFTDDGPEARGSSGYTSLDPEEFPPLQRFLVDHVTAYNNGLYGIYAFDAQHGVIRDSFASGSADSGLYVGQCRQCNILVTGNRATDNAVGFENANASDSVWIVDNDFSGNRIGMTFLSNYQEAFAPQRGNWIARNTIVGNISSDSPSHAQGGWGTGIGLSGATANLFEHNVIADNPRAGVLVSNAEDLASVENSFSGNLFSENGVDAANISSDRGAAESNCFDVGVTLLPSSLRDSCEGVQPAVTVDDLPKVTVPSGVSFLQVATPRNQPNLEATGRVPEPLPEEIGRPVGAPSD